MPDDEDADERAFTDLSTSAQEIIDLQARRPEYSATEIHEAMDHDVSTSWVYKVRNQHEGLIEERTQKYEDDEIARFEAETDEPGADTDANGECKTHGLQLGRDTARQPDLAAEVMAQESLEMATVAVELTERQVHGLLSGAGDEMDEARRAIIAQLSRGETRPFAPPAETDSDEGDNHD